MSLHLREHVAGAALRAGVALSCALLPGLASAQVSGSAVDGMTNAICQIIRPMVGQSKLVSLVFLIALAVMIFLWWLSENKEGVVVWLLRTGLAVGILINIFTLPQMIGLPSVC